jgi:hypothetical protein
MQQPKELLAANAVACLHVVVTKRAQLWLQVAPLAASLFNQHTHRRALLAASSSTVT